MNQVKQMVGAGVSLPTAIKEALGVSVSEFADRNGLNRPMTSERLNLVRAVDYPTCNALSKELGGTPYAWAVTMWEAARPVEDEFPLATSAAA